MNQHLYFLFLLAVHGIKTFRILHTRRNSQLLGRIARTYLYVQVHFHGSVTKLLFEYLDLVVSMFVFRLLLTVVFRNHRIILSVKKSRLQTPCQKAIHLSLHHLHNFYDALQEHFCNCTCRIEY